jgi:hypothetical protein
MTADPFYQHWGTGISNWWESATRRMGAATYDIRQTIAEGVSGATNGRITEDSVKTALPYVAAGAVGFGALLLNEPLGKIGKWIFTKVKWVITGGGTDEKQGFLEKLPVLGYLFKGFGWVLDTLGDLSGYLLGGLAALVSFKAFQNRGREPDGNIDTGTSRVGTVTPVIPLPMPNGGQVNAPAGIPPSPPAPPVSLPAGLNADDIEGLTHAAEEALKKGDKAVLTAIETVRGHNNQIFENRVFAGYAFLRFNGLPPGETLSTGPDGMQAQMDEVARRLTEKGTPIEMAARKNIILTLMKTKLTTDEAAGMVAEAPRLKLTPLKDRAVPDDVAEFAVAFQKYYGNDGGLPKDAAPDLLKDGGIAFEKMNITQKREFLHHAIDYCVSRYRDIWNQCALDSAPKHHEGFPHQQWVEKNDIVAKLDDPRPFAGHVNVLRWCDVQVDDHVFSPDVWHIKDKRASDPHGVSRRLFDEFAFLQDINGDKDAVWQRFPTENAVGAISLDNPDKVEFYVSGMGHCRIGTTFEKLHTEIADFCRHVDAHQVDLQRECTDINSKVTAYEKQILVSQARLRILREHKIALVTHLEEQGRNAEGMYVMTAVDLRHAVPEGTLAPRLSLTGNFQANGPDKPGKFLVHKIGTTMLENVIEIDMADPDAGMNALKARIDQIRAGTAREETIGPASAPTAQPQPAAEVQVQPATDAGIRLPAGITLSSTPVTELPTGGQPGLPRFVPGAGNPAHSPVITSI